jgi:molecular chaperone HscB
MTMDPTSLKKRLLQGSRLVHPDFHGADPAARALAEVHSARLNRAYETLADEARRADALVLLLGGPSETVAREMPREFLVEVLEWNEALEDARASKTWSPAVVRLRDELHARRQAELAGVHSLLSNPLDSSPTQLAQARARLNAVRYLDRSLTDIEALRLACAS